MLCQSPQPLGVFWLALGEHLEARLLQQVVLDFAGRSARIERQRIFASCTTLGAVAIQQPLTRFNRNLLIGHGRGHVDAVSDAMRVGNDDARPVVGFRFQEGFEGVLIFRAHCDTGDINIAVGHGHESEIFFRAGLAACRKFGDCATRC